MQNLKYHALNVISVMIFSYMVASTVNMIIKHSMSPTYSKAHSGVKKIASRRGSRSFEYYNGIIESGFFKIADTSDVQAEGPNLGSVDELTLLGTVTGPASIARALIQKKGEQNPVIFALYRINSEISNDIYGHKLVGIYNSKVYIKLNGTGERVILDMFAPKPISEGTPQTSEGGQSYSQTLSRAEVKQKVFNNMDNALRGLRAGPYRVNGQIQGYKLIQVRPYNILYKFGARSGDIVRRVNGKTVDSTEKLMGMWESIKNESKITVDLERQGKVVTYDFNIKD